METKHTPEPWAISLRHNYNAQQECQVLVIESPEGVIAEVLSDSEIEQTDIANANLIAAAPKLLKWLIVARDMLKQAQQSQEFTLGAVKNMMAIDEIINEAKGENENGK